MKVIKRSELPTHLPWTGTAVAYLLLDKFHAPSWVWGVVGTLYALVWIIVVAAIVKQDEVSVIRPV